MMWCLTITSIYYFISTILVLSQSFVITKYDPEDIADYFHKIRDYTTRKGIVDDFFAKVDLFQYCHALRQSRTFKMLNRPTVAIQPVTYLDHVITKQQLVTEKDKIEIEKLKLRVINLGNNSLKLNAFRCLDLDGAPRWIIAPGFIPQSAFLFAFELNFKNIESRNLNTSSKEILVNLMGVIDDSGTVLPGSTHYTLDILMKIGRRSGLDLLYNLHPIIQYRLCAIVGDALRRIYRNERITFMGDNVTTQNYRGLSVDSYYYFGLGLLTLNIPTDGSRIKKDWTFVTRRMLHCPITIPDFIVNSSLHLGQNIRDPTRVLIFSYTERTATLMSHDIEVPLLKYVKNYQEALV